MNKFEIKHNLTNRFCSIGFKLTNLKNRFCSIGLKHVETNQFEKHMFQLGGVNHLDHVDWTFRSPWALASSSALRACDEEGILKDVLFFSATIWANYNESKGIPPKFP